MPISSGAKGAPGVLGLPLRNLPGQQFKSPALAQVRWLMSGVTRDSTGAALPYCNVEIFRRKTDVRVALGLSDSVGNYALEVNMPGLGLDPYDPTETFYAVAFKKTALYITSTKSDMSGPLWNSSIGPNEFQAIQPVAASAASGTNIQTAPNGNTFWYTYSKRLGLTSWAPTGLNTKVELWVDRGLNNTVTIYILYGYLSRVDDTNIDGTSIEGVNFTSALAGSYKFGNLPIVQRLGTQVITLFYPNYTWGQGYRGILPTDRLQLFVQFSYEGGSGTVILTIPTNGEPADKHGVKITSPSFVPDVAGVTLDSIVPVFG